MKEEFSKIVSIPESEKLVSRRRDITLKSEYKQKLLNFQNKLASLTFLDPACGSGNFLTETFICLRRLENRVLEELTGGMGILDLYDPIKVSIKQFYGIEINDFAVTVAKTALWIAESQMMQETEEIIKKELDFLPLKTNANINEGNALRMDWNDIIPASQLSYIMGNPPFVGYGLQDKNQKEDIRNIYLDAQGKTYRTAGKVDYVACWYFKAAEFMVHTGIKAAFVSTNSITQGEQVEAVWKPIIERFGINIEFAWRTFRWDSEASLKAHVHVVIIGFSDAHSSLKKKLFKADGSFTLVDNINPYLLNGANLFIESRRTPLCDVPEIMKGNIPVDGGNLILSQDEYLQVAHKDPIVQKYCRKLLGSREFLNGGNRYCLWLKDASISEMKQSKFIMDRIEKCKNFRLSSTKAATRKYADFPWLFMEIRQPDSNFILIPRVSSERRRYIPMGFFSKDVISTDANSFVPHANLFHFGILESNVHMAWMRTVTGRLKSDYRYSNDIVYNNFPWPHPTSVQKARIEKAAQGILDARKLYPDSSLADLYDPLLMPPELKKAHHENDKAVMEAYEFNWHTMTEPECVAELMKMYQKLADAEEAKGK